MNNYSKNLLDLSISFLVYIFIYIAAHDIHLWGIFVP